VLVLAACGAGGKHLSRTELLDPTTCKSCHPTQFDDWSGSMHAFASDDPVFRAMNARGQRETSGALGSTCVKCHAPLALSENATTDGTNLDQVPAALHGVTCFFCHSADAVAGTHDNPIELATDLVMRGEYKDTIANDAHESAYASLLDRDQAPSATLCGSCHDIVVNGHAAIERTFAEWKASVFSSSEGATCGQCHMNQAPTKMPIADFPGAPDRELHSHMFPAVDVALDPSFPHVAEQEEAVQTFLNSTLQSALCVVEGGPTQSAIRVVLDNVAAGHGFPSGSAQDRRLWVEVTAYQGTNVLYQSGVVPANTSPAVGADADEWLLRDCMLDPSLNPVDMFWQADSYETNQLPAQLTFQPTDPRYYQSHIVQAYPRSTGDWFAGVPDRVTMKIHLQPMGLEVLDDLVGTGDLDASVRAMMPTYDLDLGGTTTLEWTAAAVNGTYFENNSYKVDCVTATNLNVATDKVQATGHLHCTP
jgi:hypothetical protein